MKQFYNKLLKIWFKLNEKLRFLLVGGYNTTFSFLLFCALEYYLGSNINYIAILTVTYVISVFNSFLTFRIFVFASEKSFIKEYLKVNLVYLIHFGCNTVLLFIFKDLLHINIFLSQFICIVVLTIGSYFAHKHFSFKK